MSDKLFIAGSNLYSIYGAEGGIRTHVGNTPPAYKAGAIDHQATSALSYYYTTVNLIVKTFYYFDAACEIAVYNRFLFDLPASWGVWNALPLL